MNESIVYRQLALQDVTPNLLSSFTRRQMVTKIWSKASGAWQIVDNPFVEDWTAADRQRKQGQLIKALQEGGYVAGAFLDGALKGFLVLCVAPFGSRGQYVELSSLHVSEELRGHGVGRQLFLMGAQCAKERGFERLYLSAHSAVESQAFYRTMGCVEAEEYSASHVEREPYDCQMEYRLR